ncbi:unnamed protein product [Rotaria magnacalcarata]|uniref:Clathrin light chain n=3 Tax=Rotaria magnacalcarata TaxID=392030 RepID=A0A816AZ25_9BILA|nr:unnamed protein product [Rotaria magnacalcarata]CAF1603571.1 unnamed protein product [Rotaria magnacalcarata]CAF2265627.1 unnamed protein product [Rotaria magnacalcarata]CAF4148095.1 unnamed protein product [Rotaria magnacalcarata]
MDDFDIFNQPSQGTSGVQITQVPEDDLFGSENTTNTESLNTFSNDQSTDPSWLVDDNLNNTITTTSSEMQSFDDGVLTNAHNSYLANSFSPITDDTHTDNTPAFQSDETSSYDMFSPPIPATPSMSINMFTTGTTSQENLSALEAFNRRRQQEIAEKDVEENSKIQELREQAKQDIERWYNNRKMKMKENRQMIDHAEDELRTVASQKSDKNQCDWAKLIRFLELNPGTQLSKAKRDLSRMKTSIINAKRDNDKRQTATGV